MHFVLEYGSDPDPKRSEKNGPVRPHSQDELSPFEQRMGLIR